MTKITNSKENLIFHNIGHICRSRDGLFPSPRVIKDRDRVQDRVIDIRVRDQDQTHQSWSRDRSHTGA